MVQCGFRQISSGWGGGGGVLRMESSSRSWKIGLCFPAKEARCRRNQKLEFQFQRGLLLAVFPGHKPLLCTLDTNHSLSLSLSFLIRSVQSSSVAQSRLTLCNPVDCSMPGLPVYHQLAQTHVHGVSDAIQPSHSLSSPSPAFNLSQHQGLFK